jgi:hypothetical protein
MEKFQTYSDTHSIKTRHKHDLHMLNANLITHQKDAYYRGIKSCNILSMSIITLNHNIKAFKPALKNYVLSQN